MNQRQEDFKGLNPGLPLAEELQSHFLLDIKTPPGDLQTQSDPGLCGVWNTGLTLDNTKSCSCAVYGTQDLTKKLSNLDQLDQGYLAVLTNGLY